MKPTLGLLAVTLSAWPICQANLAAQSPNEIAVVQILESESAGERVDRRRLVVELLAPADAKTNRDELRWQGGFLSIDNEWRAIESLSPHDVSEDYLRKRSEVKDSPAIEVHLQMARWCLHNECPKQARAHFSALLQFDPNHAEAREFLGHVQFEGEWVDGVLLAKEIAANKTRLQKLIQWTPELEAILEGLRTRQPKRITAALERLDRMDGMDALPAIEVFAANVVEDLARPLVRKMSNQRTPESCAALVRVGLAHPASDIKQLAAKEIAKYPLHFYVPGLLAMLSGETEIITGLAVNPNGSVRVETILRNELQHKENARHLSKVINVISVFRAQHSLSLQVGVEEDVAIWSTRWAISRDQPQFLGTLGRSGEVVNETIVSTRSSAQKRVAVGAAKTLAEQSKQQSRAVAQSNRELREWTHGICELLRATTNEKHPDEAKVWWQWWVESNERYVSAKPLDYRYAVDEEVILLSTSTKTLGQLTTHHREDNRKLVQLSCLAPGTLIQSESGLVPVEHIQIGDLVVAKHVDTGELSLQPVIMTTVRAPKTTIKITTKSNNTINATGGHFWWVSGYGWTQTSKLKPGMRLHTATGVTEIQDVAESLGKIETYNLVVDKFHTYFVGAERVLSYDNSTLTPSLNLVPGLDSRIVVGKPVN